MTRAHSWWLFVVVRRGRDLRACAEWYVSAILIFYCTNNHLLFNVSLLCNPCRLEIGRGARAVFLGVYGIFPCQNESAVGGRYSGA